MQPSQRCLVMEFVPESLSALIRQGPLDMSLLVLIAKVASCPFTSRSRQL